MNQPVRLQPPRSTAAGVTLIELMFGMSALAVMLALAVPSFRQMTANNHAAALESDLVSALNLARSESLNRGVPVSVCASSDGATCASANDWASGWIVFRDEAGTGVYDPASDPSAKLQVWAAGSGDVHVVATSPLASGAAVQYQPNGSAYAPASFSVYSSGCSGVNAHQVQLLGTGLVSVNAVSCPAS